MASATDNTNVLFQSAGVDKWLLRHIGTSGDFSLYNYVRGGEDLNIDSSTGAATFSGNVTVDKTGAADTVFLLKNSTDAYAARAVLAANNDGGAIYNAFVSSTTGGAEHFKIWGGAAVSTMAFSTGGIQRMTLDASGDLTTTGAATFGGNVVGLTFESSVSSSSTNLATNSGGSLTLKNTSVTDGNFSNIGGYNSNTLVTSQINFVNVSQASRTGAITFNVHNGTSMPEVGRFDASGNLGIGTDSPTYKLNVLSDAGAQNIFQAGQSGVSNGLSITSDGTNLTYSFLTGNVGIGTAAPESIVHIKDTGNVTTTLQIEGAATGYAPVINFDGIVAGNADYLLGEINGSWDTHTNVVSAIRFESGADTTNKDDGLISFWTSSSGPTLEERMRIDISGNLGLGVVPSAWGGTQKSLQLPGNSVFAGGNDVGTIVGNNMYWDGSAYKYIATAAANMLQFSAGSYLFRQALSGTAGNPITFTTAMTLDTSGTLLVGKSATAFGTAGVEASASNGLWSTRSGLPALALNRLSTDGSIADFYKDGATVGSIVTWDSDFVLGQVNVAFKFDDGSNKILPWSVQTNLNRDNAIDLGASDSRWKDLYLSGGVVFGATGGSVSSKTLDDYEEGTWTPVVGAGGMTGTSITYTATYTKIGNIVTLFFKAYSATGDIVVPDYQLWTGLPFTVAATGTSTVTTEDIDQFARQGYSGVGGSSFAVSACGSATGTNSLETSITYKTT
jgi:hypothetical protein